MCLLAFTSSALLLGTGRLPASVGSERQSAPRLLLERVGGRRLVYVGSKMGVSARVVLLARSSVAAVTLEGLPLGGEVSGTASLNDEGKIVVEPLFESALLRRRVQVVSVFRDARSGTLEVRVRVIGLPMCVILCPVVDD